MANAKFNTKILSANSDNIKNTKQYDLREVINSDLKGEYKYAIKAPLSSLTIYNQYVLYIPPKFTGLLEIEIINKDNESVIATTNIYLEEGKKYFSDEINKVLNNVNVIQNISTIKSGWDNIISNRISKETPKTPAENGGK